MSKDNNSGRDIISRFLEENMYTDRECFILPAGWRDFLCGPASDKGLWKPEYEKVSRFIKALENETQKTWRCVAVSKPFLAGENDFDDSIGYVCRYHFISTDNEQYGYENE